MCQPSHCAGPDGKCLPLPSVKASADLAFRSVPASLQLQETDWIKSMVNERMQLRLFMFPPSGSQDAYLFMTRDGKVLSCDGIERCSLRAADVRTAKAPSCAFRFAAAATHPSEPKGASHLVVEPVNHPGMYFTLEEAIAVASTEEDAQSSEGHHSHFPVLAVESQPSRCPTGILACILRRPGVTPLQEENCIWLKFSMALVWILLIICLVVACVLPRLKEDHAPAWFRNLREHSDLEDEPPTIPLEQSRPWYAIW